MKYVITAKNIRDGRDHVTDPTARTEICTELILTRLKAIELLNTGVISRDDCIVTREDRYCLYQNIFTNIISWELYCHLKTSGEIAPHAPIDLASQIDHLDQTLPFKPFYQNFKRDKEHILNIDMLYDTPIPRKCRRPFICILNRQTPNHAEKNLSGDYWNSFIAELDKHRTVGIGERVMLYSFGTPLLHRTAIGWHIDKLSDWFAILNNRNCKCVISTTSGGVYPIFFTGHPKSKLFIIDNNKLVAKHSDSPSFYNPCINFTNTHVKVIEHVPSAEELVKSIIEYAEL